MTTHGARTGTLVVILAGLLGCEGETTESAPQRSGGSEDHGDEARVDLMMELLFLARVSTALRLGGDADFNKS